MKKLIGLAMLLLMTTEALALEVLPFAPQTLSEIKQHYQGKPFIVLFWSESCAFCMKEMAMFGRLQKQYSDLPLVTISTDLELDEQSIKNILQQHQLQVQKTWVFSGAYPEVIYRAVDKRWRGELPMTYFFDRQHQAVRHVGLVKEQELLTWLASQAEHN